MKYAKQLILLSGLLLLALGLTACVTETATQQKKPDATVTEMAQPVQAEPDTPAALPVTYQTANYVVSNDQAEDLAIDEEVKLKVGARITSTRGPQPLWDILKRLAALKGMNVSWASDVDRNVLVDVDINANDDFYEAIDNLLRQVDYFHTMSGNTIIVKYKETRQFQIAMPFTKQALSHGTGGNLLGNDDVSSNVDGTIQLKSKDNDFDIWENIKLNLDTILEVWTYRREGQALEKDTTSVDTEVAAASSTTASGSGSSSSNGGNSTDAQSTVSPQDVSPVTGGKGYYMIDKPVGLITVTAPRTILEKVDAYITALKSRLYQQISIEAKIIEVQLTKASSIGINWSNVLKNFNLTGAVTFGSGGQIYPFTYSNDNVVGSRTYSDDGTSYTKTINPGQFVSKISLDTASFSVFLNALNEEGDTKILSNPKISVMNGQPALITVGRNVTYVDKIESDLDSNSGVITYTVDTNRILSGIGMALTATVLDKDQIIMNLIPITSELEEPIEYLDVGTSGGTVGLPVVNVREMSTTVKVKNGEMLVIGGLISDSDTKTGEFAPFLGDIPFVRYLFGYEEKEHTKRELIVLLRPRII